MTRIVQGAPSYSEPAPDAAGIMNDPGAKAPINDCSTDLENQSLSTGDLPLRSGASVLGDVAEPQLLNDGQEEVFSREEVESGHIEHSADAGDPAPDRGGATNAALPSFRR